MRRYGIRHQHEAHNRATGVCTHCNHASPRWQFAPTSARLFIRTRHTGEQRPYRWQLITVTSARFISGYSRHTGESRYPVPEIGSFATVVFILRPLDSGIRRNGEPINPNAIAPTEARPSDSPANPASLDGKGLQLAPCLMRGCGLPGDTSRLSPHLSAISTIVNYRLKPVPPPSRDPSQCQRPNTPRPDRRSLKSSHQPVKTNPYHPQNSAQSPPPCTSKSHPTALLK